MPVRVEPFTIAVSDARLASVRARAEAFDWEALPDAGGWGSGVGLTDLRRLIDHWLTRFDWREQERRLNALPQFTAEVLGHRLHFVHARGDGSRPPLLLLHGWPGSFLEFEGLIAPLVADGHDVVVPSLPGYAFSGRPDAPLGPRRTAELMHRLMVELFGAGRYLVQGGDWGAAIGAWMAHGHPDAVAALHLNMVLIQAEDALPKRPDELVWATVANAARKGELPTGNGAPALLASPLVSAGALAVAAGELAGDKTKSAPDRIVLAGMAARIAAGALAGASLGPRRQRPIAALLGSARRRRSGPPTSPSISASARCGATARPPREPSRMRSLWAAPR